MALRRTLRWLAVGAVAAVSGCAATPGVTDIPTLSPRAEALSYFPKGAPLIAMVRTDARDPQLQALARAGALDGLEHAARRHGVLYGQVRSLLGHELVVGIPAVGGAPLGVLETPDAEHLQALAQARVVGHEDVSVGTYRGTRLYAGRDYAYGVRGSVLIVSRTTRDIRQALDVRAGQRSFDPSDPSNLLPPDGGRVRPLARVLGDLRPLIARLGARARAVPLLHAAERAAATVRVARGSLAIDARADTSGEGLTELDLPVSPGKRAPLALTVPGQVTITVKDLAHTGGWAQRELARAFPLTALHYRALFDRLRIDPGRQLLSYLHGPATLVVARHALVLRAQASRPARLERTLKRLPEGGLQVARHTIRIVLRDGVLVAGEASNRRLNALATAPRARPAGAHGSATFALPPRRLTDLLPAWPLTGWITATPDEVNVAVRAPLP